MNWFLLCRLLGLLGVLVGSSMLLSVPWAFPICGEAAEFEADGFRGLLGGIVCSVGIGGVLFAVGRRERQSGTIFRKEALAIVGLGWILAGLLGGLPYLF
ncbi:MAG: TrkH family potassium uptake protein, partial [Planctomycetaceae bacterium]